MSGASTVIVSLGITMIRQGWLTVLRLPSRSLPPSSSSASVLSACLPTLGDGEVSWGA